MNRRSFFASLFGSAASGATASAAAPVAAPAISNASTCQPLDTRAALIMNMIYAEHVLSRYLREDAYRLIRGRDGRDFKSKPSSYSDGFKVT